MYTKAEHAVLMWNSRFLSRLCDPERNRVTGQESALPGVILFILYNAGVQRGPEGHHACKSDLCFFSVSWMKGRVLLPVNLKVQTGA
jgi:hypothetical protein